mmetsp:Transcript_3746/g.8003  ORF Transcript_3746/g.8003 Transcript_3746/m.8003 type:complete len:91 (-) Transcript_3746:814-1086(-)
MYPSNTSAKSHPVRVDNVTSSLMSRFTGFTLKEDSTLLLLKLCIANARDFEGFFFRALRPCFFFDPRMLYLVERLYEVVASDLDHQLLEA